MFGTSSPKLVKVSSVPGQANHITDSSGELNNNGDTNRHPRQTPTTHATVKQETDPIAHPKTNSIAQSETISGRQPVLSKGITPIGEPETTSFVHLKTSSVIQPKTTPNTRQLFIVRSKTAPVVRTGITPKALSEKALMVHSTLQFERTSASQLHALTIHTSITGGRKLQHSISCESPNAKHNCPMGSTGVHHL